MDADKSGIYSIHCIPTGRKYVGSAIKIKTRWKAHLSMLLRGRHHSPILQNSWNAYGPSAHIFLILSTVDDVNLLLSCEQYWIDTLNAYHPTLGFNGTPKAANMLGYRHPPSSIKKMSDAKIGRSRLFSDEHRKNLSSALKGTKRKPMKKRHRIAISLVHARKRRRGGVQLRFSFFS